MKHILRYNEYLLKESVQTIQWTNSIETFIDDYKDRIRDKLVSLIMKYILNDIYPSNKDDISAEDRKKYNGLNSFDKVSFLCVYYKSLINRNISEKIASISDYLSDRTTDINVIRGLKTFDELYDLSVIYHKNLGVEYKDERMDEGPDTDVFITYPNGWYWINLNTDFSEDEKDNMGHCGQDSGKILFSLRDDKKQSHITASYDPNLKALYQIKGKYNSKPLDEYHDKIIDIILNNKYEVNYMKIGGYRPDIDFNLQDLDKKRRNTIFKKKPILKLTDKMFTSYFKKKDYTGIVSMINNGYTGYTESNIDLYGNPSEFETFKTDCENLRIDYKKIVGYCFDISKVLNNGNFELAYIAIENRAIDSEFGKSVLGIACTKGYLDIVKLLIFDKKMNVSGTTYYVNLASEHGHIDIVKLLVENGADITSDATNECLRRASEKGYIEIVKYLIDNGVDVSIKYDRSLLDAILFGHFEIAKLLVENGADINKNGNIALEYAVRSSNIDIVKYLLDNGSGVRGYSDGPIQKASMEGYYEIAKLLVENGAVKHSVVASECLKVAAKNGHYDIVKLMLDNGADVSITDNYAIRNASKNGYMDVVELLKKYGAEL